MNGQVIKDIYNYGPNEALFRLQVTIVNEKLETPVKAIYTELGVYAARLVYRDIQKEVKKSFGWAETWIAELLNYFNNYAFQKIIIPITQTTRERIEATIKKGIEERWSIEQMARQLDDTELYKFQARRIVRTETISAFNRGQYVGAESTEWETEKIWTEVKDMRTRLSHRHISGVGGQKVRMDERFSNGLLHPGDKEGRASEVVNCRCRLTVKAVRDANGRLIPKKPKYQPRERAEIVI